MGENDTPGIEVPTPHSIMVTPPEAPTMEITPGNPKRMTPKQMHTWILVSNLRVIHEGIMNDVVDWDGLTKTAGRNYIHGSTKDKLREKAAAELEKYIAKLTARLNK